MVNQFAKRHIGITENDLPHMLKTVGADSIDQLMDQTIPADIRIKDLMDLPQAMTEQEFLDHMHGLAQKNILCDDYIGMGFYGCNVPAVILRNVFENPVWYTSYTPYQAEISQGRLEALLNYQTMICDLTGLPLANCSLLDEGTGAAEAITMMFALRSRASKKAGVNTVFVDQNIFKSTLDVIQTRAEYQGIEILVGDYKTFDFSTPIFGAVVQYPANNGSVENYTEFTKQCHENEALVTVAADLMALTLLTAPGEFDADIAVGSTQRMGMPMYYGGPSAGYLSCRMEYKRQIPGRIVGVSKDANGKPTYRLALQSREQHIKREKALSNLCTAQALAATMSGFYAAYHGNDGLIAIAQRIHQNTLIAAARLEAMGCTILNDTYFDTLQVQLPEGVDISVLKEMTEAEKINLRYFDDHTFGLSFDEAKNQDKIAHLFAVLSKTFNCEAPAAVEVEEVIIPELQRQSRALNHAIFEKYHSETEMMRYMKRLDRKDISLAHSMISLGSCTMKLNAAAEMLPLSWPQLTGMHPYAPLYQAQGYQEMIQNLRHQLAVVTGFADTSLQGLSGAAGEYNGLLTIRRYQQDHNEGHRNIMLIPSSAHGTNPASSMQAGLKPVITKCDENGNVDVEDLREKAILHKDDLCGLMITYPSTHGIFEPAIREICQIIHDNGGLVFMDGANMNGQVGLTSPGLIGADVCHLNLHKTFAGPHGGGGPGVGPICVNEKLRPYIPEHSFTSEESKWKAVSTSPWGNAGLQPITYGYICMLGADGLKAATETAILSSNYLAKHFEDAYGIVYTGATGRVGHELILDCRHFKAQYGVTEADISKRMMDYGYHAPTLSFPVHGTLMVEPTESESLEELDRFIEMMLNIRKEIEEIKTGEADAEDNVMINAPHPQYVVVSDEWNHKYSREKACFPLEWVRDSKFWFHVARVDDGFGDRNLCTVSED